MTKAVYGMAGGQEINLNGLTIDGETDFATIAVSSLTPEPIAQSGNLLLTAVGRAHNTGYQYRQNEDGTYAITD